MYCLASGICMFIWMYIASLNSSKHFEYIQLYSFFCKHVIFKVFHRIAHISQYA